MKAKNVKYYIAFDVLLVIAAVAAFGYNLAAQRRINYISSIVAVCGTTALLVRDIVRLKKGR